MARLPLKVRKMETLLGCVRKCVRSERRLSWKATCFHQVPRSRPKTTATTTTTTTLMQTHPPIVFHFLHLIPCFPFSTPLPPSWVDATLSSTLSSAAQLLHGNHQHHRRLGRNPELQGVGSWPSRGKTEVGEVQAWIPRHAPCHETDAMGINAIGCYIQTWQSRARAAHTTGACRSLQKPPTVMARRILEP